LSKGQPRNSAASARRTFCLTNAYNELPAADISGFRRKFRPKMEGLHRS
jgi:hypothetical protein